MGIIRTLISSLFVPLYGHYSYSYTSSIRTLVWASSVLLYQHYSYRTSVRYRMLTNEMILDVHDALSCAARRSVAGAPRSSRQGTHEVLSGYSRYTYSAGGYSWGYSQEYLRQLARRRRRAEERAEHLLVRVSRSSVRRRMNESNESRRRAVSHQDKRLWRTSPRGNKERGRSGR